MRIGLVGDHDRRVTAHRAIPLALELAAAGAGLQLEWQWVPTEEIITADRVAEYRGLWCVPASPYRSTEGALRAIRYARERDVPFLGTCGGFQHAVIEYARNVLDWSEAAHAELDPDATMAVIAPLACTLIEASGRVRFVPGSRIARAYGQRESIEGYHCSFGLNADFRATLLAGPLRVAAEDEAGDVRAVELDGHRFFVATLFQPERAALRGALPPLVAAFVKACRPAAGKHRGGRGDLPTQRSTA